MAPPTFRDRDVYLLQICRMTFSVHAKAERPMRWLFGIYFQAAVKRTLMMSFTPTTLPCHEGLEKTES